jgi:uncharacterized protein YjdB
VNPSTGVLTAYSQGTVTITATVQDPALFSGVLQTAQIQIQVIDSFGLNFTEYTADVGEVFTIRELLQIIRQMSAGLHQILLLQQCRRNRAVYGRSDSSYKRNHCDYGNPDRRWDSMTATCTVTVIQPVEGVNISQTAVTIEIGQTYPLIATFNPANSDIKNLEWVLQILLLRQLVGWFIIRICEWCFRRNSGNICYTEDGLKVANCYVTVRQLLQELH